MGKRREPVDVGPPKLSVSPDEARRLIRQQLQEGDPLLKWTVAASQQELEGFRLSVNKWVDYTFEVLRAVFSTAEYADAFKKVGNVGFYNVYDTPQERFERLHGHLRDRFNYLEGALRKVDLLQPASPGPPPVKIQPTQRPTSIRVDIHGNVSGSAINIGDIVRDINNNLNQIHAVGADKFSEGMKAFVESINADPALLADQKKEALESVEFLSEAANQPPEKRKMGLVKATLAHIPTILATAQLAGTTWTTWEPTIKGFLGQ